MHIKAKDIDPKPAEKNDLSQKKGSLLMKLPFLFQIAYL
jgi:hypothetical protein